MIGLPPGTPAPGGEQSTRPTKITLLDYDQNNFQEKEIKNLEECFPYRDSPTVTWINVDGIHDVNLIQKIDQHFGIHPLVLEDIVNTTQRPKIEDFGENIYIVLKMLYFDAKGGGVISEQVSVILGQNYVISFQETEGFDVFNTIRERIRNNKGRVRKAGADYLAYCLLDCIVDYYFIILEKLDEKIEKLEEELVQAARQEIPQEIHLLKRDMIFLLKQIWPLREVISNFQHTETRLVRKSTAIYLRNVYDHAAQVIDTIETFRDILFGMYHLYVSNLSNKMNEVMKVLTVIATVFIPLNFIASVYGMNFKYMPELEWRWGYYSILIFMVSCLIAMLGYFKRRKWL